MKNRCNVYVITKTNMVDNPIIDIINQMHGNSAKIIFEKSLRVTSVVDGPATFIQYKRPGTVYLIKKEFDDQAFKAAAMAGKEFGVFFENSSGEWKGFYVMPHLSEKTPLLRKNAAEETVAA